MPAPRCPFAHFLSLTLLLALAFASSGCGAAIPAISGTAYYVDCARGDDANSGTSASQAWRTIEKVNDAVFSPGDGIFFRRGTTCPGALQPTGSGADGKPITIGAYGRGARPIIDGGGSEAAFLLFNQQYWHILDLEVTSGTVFGIHISGDDSGGRLNHFRLTDLVVHDVYGGEVKSKVTGLVVLSSGGENNILNDVIVDGVTAYNTNQWGGIVVAGLAGDYRLDPPVLSTNITIRNSTVHDVYGDGIVLWGVQNGLVETSVAYATGLQPAPATIGTPSSIWTWMCYDCTVQNNESYDAHSPEVDGGAYDVDWGTKNNLYQYNYGHDTDSYCFSVFGAGGLTTSNAVIRYNVCTNNGRDAGQAIGAGAMLLSTWNGGTLDGVQIYNNTFYWDPPSIASALVNEATFTGTKTNFFKNNIVFSTAPWMISTNTKLALDYNLYWYPGDKQTVWLYGDGIDTSFSDYQNGSGQDAHSLFADPRLNNPIYHEVGKPTSAFALLEDSPAIDAGSAVGDMGTQDFFGNPIPFGAGYDIGAHEWQGKNAAQLGGLVLDLTLETASGKQVSLSSLAGQPILLSFLDPGTAAARSQLVFLRSMARQYGLRVLVIVPEASLSRDDLVNFAYDWQSASLSVLMDGLGLTRADNLSRLPVTFLFGADGRLRQRWDGLALPYQLTIALQSAIGLSGIEFIP